MKSPLIAAVAGLLVLASACADATSAGPPATTEQPPETSAPPETPAPAPTTEAPTPVTEAPEPPPTTPPKPTTPPTTAPPTTAPPKPTPPPTTTPPKPTVPPPAPVNGARCLVGDWVISDTELDAYFDVVAVNAAFESIDNDGVVRVSFTDTGFVWTNDYELSMTVADVDYASVSTGSFAGSYTEANGVLAGTVERDDRGGAVTQDGKPVGDVGDLFVGINPARPMDSMPFSCDGPVLMMEAGPSAGARHAVHLSPG